MNEKTQTTTTTTAIAKKEDREVVYKAFGSDEQLRLSIAIVRNMLTKPTKQGHWASDSDCARFMMMCKARRLNPFEGDAFLVGYDSQSGPEFNLITSHQAFLKRAEVNPNYKGMESGVIVQDGDGKIVEREGDFMLEDDKLLGAWAIVYFKDDRKPMKKKCNLRTFQKNNQRWRDDPAGMVVKCAEGDALRSSFPTLLGGLYLYQEMERRSVLETSGEIAAPTSDVNPLAGMKFTAPPQTPTPPAPPVNQQDEQELADAGLAPKQEAPSTPAPAAETKPEAPAQDTPPAPENKPEPPQPAEQPAKPARKPKLTVVKELTIQEQIQARMDASKITEEEFIAVLVKSGDIKKEDAGAVTGIGFIFKSVLEPYNTDEMWQEVVLDVEAMRAKKQG